MRFLVLALRQCFFEIAIPSRQVSSLLSRQSTVKNLSRLRVAFLNTRPKAAASSKRLVFRNRRLLPLVRREFCCVVVTVAYGLRRQLRAAGLSGIGATLGLLLGAVAKFAIAFAMIGLFLVMRIG